MIGDFTWTDYDYLGEAGIGIPHYGEVTAQGMFPDRLAYCGDIDLNAARRPVSYLREIAFGLRQEPYIAVQRPEVFEKTFDQNNWKYFDSLHSWTYPGQEGRPTRVYVLADCDEVELTVNGKSLGRKKIGEALPYTAAYDVDYQPGGLKAVGYRDGKPCGEDLLGTAGAVAAMKVAVSNGTVRAGGQGLSFVTVDLVDENDTPNLSDGRAVTVKVEGAGSLQGFGSRALVRLTQAARGAIKTAPARRSMGGCWRLFAEGWRLASAGSHSRRRGWRM